MRIASLVPSATQILFALGHVLHPDRVAAPAGVAFEAVRPLQTAKR